MATRMNSRLQEQNAVLKKCMPIRMLIRISIRMSHWLYAAGPLPPHDVNADIDADRTRAVLPASKHGRRTTWSVSAPLLAGSLFRSGPLRNARRFAAFEDWCMRTRRGVASPSWQPRSQFRQHRGAIDSLHQHAASRRQVGDM